MIERFIFHKRLWIFHVLILPSKYTHSLLSHSQFLLNFNTHIFSPSVISQDPHQNEITSPSLSQPLSDCGIQLRSVNWLSSTFSAHLAPKLLSMLWPTRCGLSLPVQQWNTVYREVDKTTDRLQPSWWIACLVGMIRSALWRSKVGQEINFYSFNFRWLDKRHQQSQSNMEIGHRTWTFVLEHKIHHFFCRFSKGNCVQQKM